MSKKPSKRKVVVTTNPKSATRTPAPVRSRANTTAAGRAMTFTRDTYIWMAAGFGLVLLGTLLMSGGDMPGPEVWDEDIIYGARRTLLAPIVILAGLVVEVYAIFKK